MWFFRHILQGRNSKALSSVCSLCRLCCRPIQRLASMDPSLSSRKSLSDTSAKQETVESAPPPKRQRTDEDSELSKGNGTVSSDGSPPPLGQQNMFDKFTFKEVLKADPSHKIAFLHGSFDDGKDAVVILERMAWESDKFKELFDSGASGSLAFKNDIFHNYRVQFEPKFNETKLTLIYPATETHIKKYSSQPTHLIDESPEDYKGITLPLLKASKRFSAQLFSNRVAELLSNRVSLKEQKKPAEETHDSRFFPAWVENILDHEKESDRIVFEDSDPEKGFVLLPDLKWDGHNVDSLYLVAIVHKRGIHSIRELTGEHLPMLENIKKHGTEAISKKYGLPASRIRAFLHYQPTFFHLHVHFTNIQFDAPGRNAEKAHMLTTVISNLRLNADHYKKATIPFLVGENDPLFAAYSDRLKPVNKVEQLSGSINGPE